MSGSFQSIPPINTIVDTVNNQTVAGNKTFTGAFAVTAGTAVCSIGNNNSTLIIGTGSQGIYTNSRFTGGNGAVNTGAGIFETNGTFGTNSGFYSKSAANHTGFHFEARNSSNITIFSVGISGNVFAANYSQAFSTASASRTILATESFLAADATTAAFTLTLPTAIGITGRVYIVKKIDATANTVAINTTLSQTIDGVATFVLSAQNASVSFISNGTNWLIF